MNHKDYRSETSEEGFRYDVFISHAFEDKDEVARPLAIALKNGGLKVWYDEFELKIGDNLRRKIDRGLADTRFGVIVLSRSFFEKDWPRYEFDCIVAQSISGDYTILPIWHNVTKQEVLKYSPSLADRVARSTAAYTVEEIAKEICSVIKGL
ncbi:toll/interleukin-1 receptor domain-containing protein [Fundidesulfovibrio agrisoli]|uniref:toll/interleukin-1 receptor domain-containing protein n=1 Tax=Fundidesulfovibrio agrisoli TaxID=2922717 RepID=UPI001FABC33A|nr:toll/interleukin-1 receptor domain-containing protein [Fundidesulfovibrio agrisoli]